MSLFIYCLNDHGIFLLTKLIKDELWDDVERGRYGVEKNLFVQMDSDRLDQTSRLASFIKAASSK